MALNSKILRLKIVFHNIFAKQSFHMNSNFNDQDHNQNTAKDKDDYDIEEINSIIQKDIENPFTLDHQIKEELNKSKSLDVKITQMQKYFRIAFYGFLFLIIAYYFISFAINERELRNFT